MMKNGGFAGGCFLLLVILAVAAAAVLGTAVWMREKEAPEPAAEAVSPWAETDALLGDRGAQRREDVRPEMARSEVAKAKEERVRLEAEERKARAEAEERKRELAQLRADTAAAERRLERFRAEARENPGDEETKDLLYGAYVALEGDEGREGLRNRSVRAEAELSEALTRADGIRRRLQELNSDIARSESNLRRVEGSAGYKDADETFARGKGAARAVAGLAASTESEAADASAEAAGRQARQDRVVEKLLEEQ